MTSTRSKDLKTTPKEGAAIRDVGRRTSRKSCLSETPTEVIEREELAEIGERTKGKENAKKEITKTTIRKGFVH